MLYPISTRCGNNSRCPLAAVSARELQKVDANVHRHLPTPCLWYHINARLVEKRLEGMAGGAEAWLGGTNAPPALPREARLPQQSPPPLQQQAAALPLSLPAHVSLLDTTSAYLPCNRAPQSACPPASLPHTSPYLAASTKQRDIQVAACVVHALRIHHTSPALASTVI
jgi:hypothetical protein